LSITHYSLLIFSGAVSGFPLYLLVNGLRCAASATQKDAVAIRARDFVILKKSVFALHSKKTKKLQFTKEKINFTL